MDLERVSHYRILEKLGAEASTRVMVQTDAGELYLRQPMGKEAAAEFKWIVDHRANDYVSPAHALAHLGLARAEVLDNDTPAARKSYQDFFAAWKDADPDLPAVTQARKEYEQLK